VVQTVGFKTLYVLFFIRHGRRELIHFNVTASPTAAWIWQQVPEATPWGRYPSHLIHDRDSVYGRDLDNRLARLGISGVRTPFRAPRPTRAARIRLPGGVGRSLGHNLSHGGADDVLLEVQPAASPAGDRLPPLRGRALTG